MKHFRTFFVSAVLSGAVFCQSLSGTAASTQLASVQPTVESGLYAIASFTNENLVLELQTCTVMEKEEQPLQLYPLLDTNQQKFYIEKLAQNTYRISTLTTGEALTAELPDGFLDSGITIDLQADASDLADELQEDELYSAAVFLDVMDHTVDEEIALLEAETEVETEVMTEAESESKSEAVTETESESTTEAISANEPTIETTVKTNSESITILESEVVTKTDSKTETEAESKSEAAPEAATEISSKPENSAESETGSVTESETVIDASSESKTEAGSSSETEPKSETETEAESASENATEAVTETESETAEELEMETVPETEIETEAESESETEAAIILEDEMEIEMETESETEEEIEPAIIHPQIWSFEPTDDGFFYIRSADGKYLTLESRYAYTGESVSLKNFTGNDNQKWSLTKTWSSPADPVDTDLVNPNAEDGAYRSFKLKLKFGEKVETLTAEDFSAWMLETEDHQLKLDREAITAYVTKLAEKYDTQGQPRQFTTSYGSTITLYKGNFGWKMDVEGTVEIILEAAADGKYLVTEPKWSHKGGSFDAESDIGDSYVEVDLGNQKVWLYVNGEQILETDCVTGTYGTDRQTPGGVYSVYYRQSPDVLEGPGYSSPVEYWMAFNGGIGLHDANWRSEFGGDIYLTNGSHGCVNLPTEAAAKIYEVAQIGFPVVCYN